MRVCKPEGFGIVAAVGVAAFTFAIIKAIVKREVQFGMGNSPTIRRADNPRAYWRIIAMMTAFTIAWGAIALTIVF
jgi:hypothetical protein